MSTLIIFLFLAAGLAQAQNVAPTLPRQVSPAQLAALLKAVETQDGPDAASIRTNAA